MPQHNNKRNNRNKNSSDYEIFRLLRDNKRLNQKLEDQQSQFTLNEQSADVKQYVQLRQQYKKLINDYSLKLSPNDYIIEQIKRFRSLNLWCENCSKDNNKSDDEYVIVKGEDQTIESISFEPSFSRENNNLKSFGLDEESIKKFCIDYFSINNSYHNKDLREQLINNKQEFDKVIKDKDSKVKEYKDEIQNLKDEIVDLEKNIEYYRKESQSSWTKCNKLVKELEIVQNSEKRLLEELNDVRPKKRRHSVH
jgi:hypothetical protein